MGKVGVNIFCDFSKILMPGVKSTLFLFNTYFTLDMKIQNIPPLYNV